MLNEISDYASTIFCRSYEVQNFNYVLKDLTKSGILIQGDGTSIPEDKYVLKEGAELGWKL
ncbi:hypothetical protein [Parapedobacter tibetensis]|uniref:hypothetical protein n=1 Tax=Parapedobacter tibetensis TaxID=2972951 RepID=UPI00214DC87D|nr:hypothetical protein [Parapedobacter tibetensis]